MAFDVTGIEDDYSRKVDWKPNYLIPKHHLLEKGYMLFKNAPEKLKVKINTKVIEDKVMI